MGEDPNLKKLRWKLVDEVGKTKQPQLIGEDAKVDQAPYEYPLFNCPLTKAMSLLGFPKSGLSLNAALTNK